MPDHILNNGYTVFMSISVCSTWWSLIVTRNEKWFCIVVTNVPNGINKGSAVNETGESHNILGLGMYFTK